MPKSKNIEKNGFLKGLSNMFSYLNTNITALNQSKIFAGLMIIILNIASKFVTIKVSKTMESYLKFTFSRDLLVFAITWMGTRDIYTALVMTIFFIIIVDYLMNEQSNFCVLSESFTDYHVSKLESNCPTPEEVIKAKLVIETAEKCNKEKEQKDHKELDKGDDNLSTTAYNSNINGF